MDQFPIQTRSPGTVSVDSWDLRWQKGSKRNVKAQLAKDAPLNADFYIADNEWWMEQKLDGQRFLIRMDGKIMAVNRHGVEMTVPAWLHVAFLDGTFSKGQWEFDGELVNGHYYIFDCMYAGNKDLRGEPFSLRRIKLEQIYGLWNPGKFVHLTRLARNTHEKSILYTTLFDAQAEGAVVKKHDAKYREGKKINHLLKLKFVTDCDVAVMELEREGKPLAITIGLYREGKLVEVSGCKVPASVATTVKPYDVITVNYLYATDDDKLTQPTFGHVRTDKSWIDCGFDQLKYTSRAVL